MLLLRVNHPGSAPPQVRPLGRIRWSSSVNSCQFLGAVRLGFLAVCMQRRYLVSGSSDRFKDSMTITAAPGCWSLGVCARRLSCCHRQGQIGSDIGVATAAHRRLVLAAVVVSRYVVHGPHYNFNYVWGASYFR